jgi:hypothetical protein
VFDIVQRTNTEDPDLKDVAELRKLLKTTPDLWRMAGDLAGLAREELIQRFSGTPLAQESLKTATSEICCSLGYEHASGVERLLIEHVVMCWLRLNWMEIQYTRFRVNTDII